MLQRIIDGRTDLVFEYLAERKISQAMDADGRPLILWCAYYGDVSAIRFLVQKGEALAALGENLGLNAAAFHGHWQLCEFLIEHGASVNYALADTGETPLHAALCKANRPAYDIVVRVLVAAGADPNAVTRPSAPTGAFMRDCTTKAETPLHRAAAFGSEDTIQRLLDAGAAIDAKDMNGDSPLAWASWHLRPDAILRKLSYNGFSIHPERRSTFDHGMGWGAMEIAQLGTPHTSTG
ncbi:MAG TPA: ankyrin repeat domain-containing protein [Thermoanaerobaculia bacterium]|nr:ankyrin repeat domain-containing protein [Thermoanaerobaculia bacterium]